MSNREIDRIGGVVLRKYVNDSGEGTDQYRIETTGGQVIPGVLNFVCEFNPAQPMTVTLQLFGYWGPDYDPRGEDRNPPGMDQDIVQRIGMDSLEVDPV